MYKIFQRLPVFLISIGLLLHITPYIIGLFGSYSSEEVIDVLFITIPLQVICGILLIIAPIPQIVREGFLRVSRLKIYLILSGLLYWIGLLLYLSFFIEPDWLIEQIIPVVIGSVMMVLSFIVSVMVWKEKVS